MPRGAGQGTHTFHFALFPGTHHNSTLFGGCCAVSVEDLSSLELSLDRVALGAGALAVAVFGVLKPSACVGVAVRVHNRSLAVPFVTQVLSLVHRAVGPHAAAKTGALAVLGVSGENGAVLEFADAVTGTQSTLDVFRGGDIALSGRDRALAVSLAIHPLSLDGLVHQDQLAVAVEDLVVLELAREGASIRIEKQTRTFFPEVYHLALVAATVAICDVDLAVGLVEFESSFVNGSIGTLKFAGAVSQTVSESALVLIPV